MQTHPMLVTVRSSLLSQSICLKQTTQCVFILQLDVHQACKVTMLLAANNALSPVIVGQGNA